MSTTFDVFPGTSAIPTTDAILKEAEHEFHRFLAKHGLASLHPRFSVVVLARTTNEALVPDPLDVAWPPDAYAWFTIDGLSGGTDAYFQKFDDASLELWADQLHEPAFRNWKEQLRAAIDVGHCWSFRRSAGQTASISVAYACLAATLARLTGGFLFSDDCAWESSRLPARPSDFLSWYFDPEQATEPDFIERSRRALLLIPDELRRTRSRRST